jgi:hypothetical protein
MNGEIHLGFHSSGKYEYYMKCFWKYNLVSSTINADIICHGCMTGHDILYDMQAKEVKFLSGEQHPARILRYCIF